MMMFDDMGFCGDLDMFCGTLGEGDIYVRQTEPNSVVEDDYSDEEMDVNELERRIWRDKMRLKQLKEQTKAKEGIDAAKARQSQEQARRKKMSRAQDGILKYMLKMMEVCKAQGFIYGIIPEKGKPVTGASDNLREWWKDKVRFDRNGPTAIAKYQDESNFDVEDRKPENLHPSNLGMERMRGMFSVQQPSLPIKGEVITNLDFIRKRKISSDFNLMMDHKIYTCEHPQCPYSDVRLAFQNRPSRDNHQLNCPHRIGSADYGGPNFHATEVKPVIFPQSFVQPNSAAQPASLQSFVQPNSAAQPTSLIPPSFDLTRLGVSEGSQKMISDLMSVYDTNIIGNKNVSSTNCAAVGNQNLSQHNIQQQQHEISFLVKEW
ncbi:hypothetical protein RYX36_005931 [Vicia faba]